MKDNNKAQFKRTASDNNGGIQVNIPPEIAEHLNLEKGEKIGIQTEHSDKYGKYASFWNHSKQEQGEE
jgi:hypothetical protein